MGLKVIDSRNRSHAHGKHGAAGVFAGVVAGILGGLFAFGAIAAQGVYGDHVEPHWDSSGERFWYRNSTRGGGREFVRIDAVKGTREAAFDHAKVAIALGKVTGAELRADHLPIDLIEPEEDGTAVRLIAGTRAWRLDLKSYGVTTAAPPKREASLAPSARANASRSGGAETSIRFDNHTGDPVDIFWLDPTGKRVRYATVAAGESWEQQTYAGHVWAANDKTGKSIGNYEATEHAATVILGAMPATRPAARRERRGENRGATRGPNSPDGLWAVAMHGDDLMLRDKAGGAEFPLTTDGKPDDGYAIDRVWWSADSSHLVAMRVAAGQEHKVYTVESSPKDQLQPKLRTIDYLKAGDRIEHSRPCLFDVATRKQVRIPEELFPNPWSIQDVRWAADSSRFTFVYNQRGHQALRIIAVAAADGSARAIVEEISKTFIDYSGKQYSHWLGDDELIWMSERDGWNHLWLIDARSGRPKNVLGAGEYVVQKVLRIDDTKRQAYFTAGGVLKGMDPYYSQVCRVNFDGSGFTVLTEGDGTHSVERSPDGKYLIDVWSRVDQPPVSELRRAVDGGWVCRLEQADASEALTARGRRWPERFVAKGRDGETDIHGIIHYPRDFDASRRYPVVEQIYAGPQDYFTPKAFRTRYGTAETLADMGLIVVQCDGMGTSGRSKAFHDVCWKNLRDAGFPDRIAWITAAAKTRPWMDLSRVGIYGGSAGGQNAMAALLWHNDFYKVAVADCGCHDNRMDKIWWNEQWMGWPVGKEYAENSNAFNAGLMKGKLLLMFGELDDNVDPSSTLQVVNALEKADKDFELVIVTGAKHGSAETPYGSRRRAEFLVRNLR